MPAVAFEHVDIVFGGNRGGACAMLDAGGATPREVIAATDCVPGAVESTSPSSAARSAC